MSEQQTKKPRGFACMDKDKQREIASKGGKAAHAAGTAHEFTPQEAANAGRKGGERVSANRAHMAEIGRKGGIARTRSPQKAHEQGEQTEPPPPPDAEPRDSNNVPPDEQAA